MKTQFVETENWKRLANKAAALRALSPEEPRFGIIYGRTGLGKTMAVRRYAARNGCIYLRALDVWSPTAMLRALAHEVAAYEWREKARCFADVARKLNEEPRPIIIDEADYLTSDRHLLNTIRDLHDGTGVAFLLVGEEKLPVNLQHRERAHFWGRVAAEVPFVPLTGPEISLISRELCGLDLIDELAESVRLKSHGEFRWAKKLLRQVETILGSNKAREVTPAMIEMAMRAINRRAA